MLGRHVVGLRGTEGILHASRLGGYNLPAPVVSWWLSVGPRKREVGETLLEEL